jgi:hypothetical protein
MSKVCFDPAGEEPESPTFELLVTRSFVGSKGEPENNQRSLTLEWLPLKDIDVRSVNA